MRWRGAEPQPPDSDLLPILCELMSGTTAARRQAAEMLGARDRSRIVHIAVPGTAQPVLCNHDSYRRPNLSVQDFTCASVLDGRLLSVRATFGMESDQPERAHRAVAGLLILIRSHLSGTPPTAAPAMRV